MQSIIVHALEHALQETIRQHAGLRYGISDEKKDDISLYRQVHVFDQKDVFEVIMNREVADQDEEQLDEFLSRVLEKGHAQLWSQNRPAWKAVIINDLGSSCNHSDSGRLLIAFFAHHAIADGLSGAAFHASLMKNLKISSHLPLPAQWPLELNDMQPAPPAIEQKIDCLSCDCAPCNSTDACGEAVWAGNSVSSAPTVNFESRVRIVTVSARQLSSILEKCRQAKVTLTGLLHSVVCKSLNNSITERVPGFRSVTPFSVRRHTGVSDAEIVNHISYLTSFVPEENMQDNNDCTPGSTFEEDCDIDLARQFTNEVATKVKQYPHGGMVTRQSKVKDTLSACRSQGGSARRYTYELSNLGAITSISPPEGNGIELKRLVFTQSGFVAGPALGFNCASIQGGDLTISVTWQKGVVAETVVEAIVQELKTRLGGCR